MNALEVRDLHKSFGGLRVATAVNLAVAPGERRLIIGQNGAGKTTLFNLITGELRIEFRHRLAVRPRHHRGRRHAIARISAWRAPIRSSRCSPARRCCAT